MPVKLTVCGLPLALSVMASVELLSRRPVGLNVTLIVQLAPAASELPQLLVWAKSPLLPPLVAILLISKGPLPVLDKVTL